MDAGSNRTAPVADKTRATLVSFYNLLWHLPDKTLDSNDNEHVKVREHVFDNLTRFKIWAGSIGAYHVDNKSADYRVREAPEIRQHLFELLNEVVEANEDLLAALTDERQPDVEVSGVDGEECLALDANEELTEICLTVGDVISSLLKVSGLLRKSTGRDRYAKAAATNEPAYLEGFDIRHIECKYPKVSRTPGLAERLGRANILRRQYLRYARKHHDRLSHDPEHSSTPGVAPAARARTLSVSGIENRTLFSSRPTLAQTDASTLMVDCLPRNESGRFEIEDLEGSRSQATSVVTSNAGYREREGLEVIPLSDVSKDGRPFECPYCWTIIQSQRQSSWR